MLIKGLPLLVIRQIVKRIRLRKKKKVKMKMLFLFKESEQEEEVREGLILSELS